MTACVVEGEEFELELSSEPESVGKARQTVARIAERAGANADDVSLAVSEAVGNAVTHAFRDREPGTIGLRARREGGRLVVAVADDGIGMTPNPGSPGLGFGLALIAKLTEDVRFVSSGNGTVVSMCFALGSGGTDL